MHIIIIEDQLDLADLMKSILEKGGHSVVIHPTRWQAIQTARSFNPDVVISDYLIPHDMEMPKFLEAIRTLSTLKCVIIMSGYKEAKAMANQCQAEFILKPFTVQDISAKINACVRATPN